MTAHRQAPPALLLCLALLPICRSRPTGRWRSRGVVRACVGRECAWLGSGEGARHFVSMLGRAFADPDPSVKWLFLEEMVPVFRLFFQVMAVALPDLPPERLFWRLHFLIGSMGHILAGRFAGKGERGALSFFDLPAGLSSEQVSGVDIQEELIRFVSAGLEA